MTAPLFVRAAVGVHAGAAAGLYLVPSAWPYALGAIALTQAAITTAVLTPKSAWLGPNVSRLGAAAAARGEVAVTLDDGPDPEVTPEVLDALDAHGARATFFWIGSRVAAHPELARAAHARGHRVENHTHRHPHAFGFYTPRAMERELRGAQDAIAAATGRRPLFFRAPVGIRNPGLDGVLRRLGLRLVSWTRRGYDGVGSDPGRIAARLVRGLAAGDLLVLHDGSSVGRKDRRATVVTALTRVLHAVKERGLRPVTLEESFDRDR